MIGAIIGDIVGSPYEFNQNNIKTTTFPLFCEKSRFTDDTVMTCAVANAFLDFIPDMSDDDIRNSLVMNMRMYGMYYPDIGYGPMFKKWLFSNSNDPIGSYGNGSAMRVSSVAWLFDDLVSVQKYARISAEVTHNHPEGIKGAQAVASAIFLARIGTDKQDIADYIKNEYGYDLSKSCAEIRPGYTMNATCQGSVPQAIQAFIEGDTFVDCIKLAVSLGGDSDTIACITGSIAEGYYHIPEPVVDTATALIMKQDNVSIVSTSYVYNTLKKFRMRKSVS